MIISTIASRNETELVISGMNAQITSGNFPFSPRFQIFERLFRCNTLALQALENDVALPMKLFLIRHGETVDNVAGLYAGTKDSTLTNHGVEQTNRLGQHFARNNVKFTHIFASPLSRAFKTAQAVQKAQHRRVGGEGAKRKSAVEIIKVPEIIERDFGFYEGKPFNTRADPKSPEGEAQNEKNKSLAGFKDVESKESMAERIDKFLNEQLLPLLDEDSQARELVVAVVAHGMLLSSFWRRLLLRLPRKSLTIAPEITAAKGNVILEYLGGWSNTGYMELSICKDQQAQNTPGIQHSAVAEGSKLTTLPTPVPPRLDPEDAKVSLAPTTGDEQTMAKAAHRTLDGCSTTILAIDSTMHLLGLKRQRGGIGSLAHDEGQRKLDGFFKKPRFT
ncbi:hypothetical protein LTR37_010918 [Vermiconidia calcicola]|uniref:Uncharacterized protein n=1 Tax=Vermiconidia calcicola TaxID=1690605 RepID=A0ACC3N3J1_9PEZI|nr:hypothetical protein LTR37_010918 [Vermiconidia calcicola]